MSIIIDTILNKDGFAIGKYYPKQQYMLGTHRVNISKSYTNTTRVERLMFLRNLDTIENPESITCYLSNEYGIDEFCKDSGFSIHTGNNILLGENEKGDWI